MNLKNTNAFECKTLIIKEKDNHYKIDIVNNSKPNKLIYKLNNNSNDKIIELVTSFLETTTIDTIDISTLYSSSIFIEIRGYRSMYIHLKNKQLLKRLILRIENKYNRDRYKYLLNNSIQNNYCISLNENETSYHKDFIDHSNNQESPKYIQLNLMYNDKKISVFDEKFIEKFIYDKLWDIGLPANLEEKTHSINNSLITDGYYIRCKDLTIIFNCNYQNQEYVYKLCNEIINKYNNELMENEKIMKKQLKMEGF